MLLGYSGGRKLAAVDAAKGLRTQTLSGRYEVLSNGYFFFFLADFFAFFAFFAFLAMLPSVTPKLAQCRPTFGMHSFRLHHDYKIDTASFKEGKRPAAVATCTSDEALASPVDAPRLAGSRGKLSYVQNEADDEKPNHHGGFDRMVELI